MVVPLTLSSDDSHLIERSFPRILVYTILTLGIYGFYWFYSMNKQIKLEYDESYNPFWRTIGLLIPIYDILVLWRVSNTVTDTVIEDQNGPVIFLLWIVFFPAAIYLVQDGINKQLA